MLPHVPGSTRSTRLHEPARSRSYHATRVRRRPPWRRRSSAGRVSRLASLSTRPSYLVRHAREILSLQRSELRPTLLRHGTASAGALRRKLAPDPQGALFPPPVDEPTGAGGSPGGVALARAHARCSPTSATPSGRSCNSNQRREITERNRGFVFPPTATCVYLPTQGERPGAPLSAMGRATANASASPAIRHVRPRGEIGFRAFVRSRRIVGP
jgi:hypothetical protein